MKFFYILFKYSLLFWIIGTATTSYYDNHYWIFAILTVLGAILFYANEVRYEDKTIKTIDYPGEEHYPEEEK